MTTIKVMLNDQDVEIVQNPLLASGDLETVILHADFSKEWDGFGKTAVFYQNEKNVYHAVMNGNGDCIVPWEVMQAEGVMYFGIFGAKNDTRKTSEVAKYRIRKGAWSEETAVHDPTPDIYTQILSNVAAHAKNKNNPHGVTIAQIGAAPDGYGLGLENGLYLDDCDKGTAFGLFIVGWQTANNPLNSYGALLVMPHNNTEKCQVISSSFNNCIVVRYMSGGAWSEWEWVNPTMFEGVEYRTTERHNGKAVYTVLFNVGNFAAGGVAVTTDFSTTGIVRYSGYCNGFSMPIIWDRDTNSTYTLLPQVYVNSSKIRVIVSGGSQFVGKPVYIQAWYTKE